MSSQEETERSPAIRSSMVDMIDIGDKLRKLRQAADMSLQQAAYLMGWKSRSNLSKIELGHRSITTIDYDRLLKIYGAPNPNNAEEIIKGLRDIVQDPNMTLQVVAVSNNELEPDMRAGDHVMVDTKVRRVTREGVYLIQPGSGEPELFRGRRHPITDKVVLATGRADGSTRGVYAEIEDSRVDVLGRVVWTMRRIG